MMPEMELIWGVIGNVCKSLEKLEADVKELKAEVEALKAEKEIK